MSDHTEITIFNVTITGWKAKAIVLAFLASLVALGYYAGIQHQ